MSITAEGSDDQYLREIGEIGSSKPVDYTTDFNAVRAALPQIDGVGIIDGAVNVEGTESGDILITIE